MSKSKKKFLRQERTTKFYKFLIGILFLMLVNLVLSYLLTGKFFDVSYAQKTLRLSQEILPLDPIEKVGEIQKQKSSQKDLATSQYRVTVPLSEKKEETASSDKSIGSELVSFRGRAIYPSSDLLLEIASDRLFVSATSDVDGNWNWNNYGQLLESGEHSIWIYNISPYEISGKRDVFIQKYRFTVTPGADSLTAKELVLNDVSSEEIASDGILGNKFLSGNLQNIFLFDAILLNKETFNSGEEINLELLFSPLGLSAEQPARISYELYALDGQESKLRKISDFEDNVTIGGGSAFLKQMKLKDKLVGGNYVLKLTAQIGSDKHIQSIKFSVGDKEMVKIGSMTITQNKFDKTLFWNSFFLILLAIAILILIILEYGRFLRYGSISERNLRKQGFFTK